MSREIMQQALTVLKAWDALIKYQYGGSSEAMTAMQNVAWRTLDTIEGLETALAQPEQDISYTDIQMAELIMSDCGHSSDYTPLLNRIAGRLATYRQALAQPEQDWDLLAATQESLREHQARIKKLEAQLAQPEQEPVACGYDETVGLCTNNPCCEQAQPEQFGVSFPSFMRKRLEQTMEDAIKPQGMSVHDGKVKVLVSDLHRMLLVIDSAPPRKAWVSLSDTEINKIVDLNTSDDGGFDIWCDGIAVAHIVCAKLKEKNA